MGRKPKAKVGRPRIAEDIRKVTRIFIALNAHHKLFIQSAAESRGIAMANLILNSTIEKCEEIMGQNFNKFILINSQKETIEKGMKGIA